jgi:hypothetical protein
MDMKVLFEPFPRFGLRGDDVLWKKMSEMNLYGDDIIDQLREVFYSILGYSDGKENRKYVSSLDNSTDGMSHGYVSLTWWEKEGFPLLIKRLKNYSEEKL